MFLSRILCVVCEEDSQTVHGQEGFCVPALLAVNTKSLRNREITEKRCPRDIQREKES